MADHCKLQSEKFNRFKTFITTHQLISFFFFAYVGSWIFSIPCILIDWGLVSGNFTFFFTIKAFAGPFLASYVVTFISEGKEGVVRFRANLKMKNAKIKRLYLLFALIVVPVCFVFGVLVQCGGFDSLKAVTFSQLLKYPFLYLLVIFGGGPLAEEPGWRGFALPRLQNRFGPFLASLILGILWLFWHLPDFLTTAQGGGPNFNLSLMAYNFALFGVLVISLSFIFTWIVNGSQGNIFIALILHASVNTPQVAILPLISKATITHLNLSASVTSFCLCIIVLIATSGKLGFKAD